MPGIIKRFITAALIAAVSLPLFALDDSVLLQSTPIFVGEDSFTARIDAIKAEGREPLGLVMSGGSARAYAHIGVLREFEKHDVKPDFIVANSMGAIIGMLYSAGFSADDIEYIVQNVELNSFFDLVFPTKGGFLSQRYFQEALSRLFPDRHFDLKHTYIPIIIPAEDLVTKRCVWFAEGDFVTVMTAAFAMSAMMEPLEYTLPNGNQALLVDAGTVDLGCISIAERFSHNLIISTAFYTANMNLYNPIVIINRTTSIGKERRMISDILESGYPYIRNAVENFSFMDFANVSKLITVGEECAAAFFDTHDTSDWPTWSSYRQKHPEVYSKLRTQRNLAAHQFVSDVQHGLEPYSPNLYTNLKIRPSFAVIDTPDLYFNTPFSAGLYGLIDYRSFKGRAGIHAGTETYGADTWIRLRTESGAESLTVASADLPYAQSYQNLPDQLTWYGAEQFSWDIPVSTNSSFTPFAAVEAGTDLLFGRAGVTFAAHTESNTITCSLTPFGYFLQAPDLDHTGAGATASVSSYALPAVGFALSDSFRWQQNGYGIVSLTADTFRGKTGSEALKATGSDTWINISKTDVFLYMLNTSYTAMEMFKLEKVRSGLFFDTAVTGSTVHLAAGADTCLQVSLVGLSTLNLNSYLGWDITEESLTYGFSIVTSF